MKKKHKRLILRIFVLLIGIFLVAVNYNMFLLPNDLVIGGVSGLAIIIKKVCFIDPVLFIYFINVLLIIISFFVLGWKKTSKSVIGSLLFPLFISLTAPLTAKLNISFQSDIIMVLVSGLMLGVGSGLIYKTGFTTGGMDILSQIFGDKKKVSFGTALLIINVIIVLAGGYIFGYEKVVYAILILFLNSTLVDRILLGISDSKMFFIYTTKVDEVKKYITEDINTGVTILKIEGGYSSKRDKMLMCVIRTRDYFSFKETILGIDPKAFLVINDCYEVMGGVKKANLPFI
ncbi:MAG TPA: YitT family protein [Bacilli bacterium]|nr:YitT family protein [Bacilli bacterium]